MNETRTASQQIIDEVTSWPGVTAGPGHRGELAFTVGHREIGHLHGDSAVHFGFPKHVWVELRDQGRIEPHPVFPDSIGPAARRLETEADVRDVIGLLRLNFDRLVARAAAEAAGQAQSAQGTTLLPSARRGLAHVGE